MSCGCNQCVHCRECDSDENPLCEFCQEQQELKFQVLKERLRRSIQPCPEEADENNQ